MRFGYVILYVRSVPDTVAFYESAFGLERGLVLESGEYGELRTGATKLAFANQAFAAGLSGLAFEAAAPANPAPPFEVGLVADDVEAAFERAVAAGAQAVKAPARKPWGQMVGYVRDRNGFLVEICSPMPD